MLSFLRFLALLPLWFYHALGVALGWLIYAASARYRRVLRENLSAAGYDSAAIRRIVIAESGKGIAELIPVWYRSRPSSAGLMRDVTGADAIENALNRGKGIIFVTPHLGCFEVTAQWYTHVHGPMTALFSPPKKGLITPFVMAGRSRPNLKLAAPDMGGIRALLRALKAGEAVGILPDQAPGKGEGEWAMFFGRPAYTMTLVERLRQSTDAQVLVAYAERLPWGAGYHGYAELMPPRQDAESAARHLNRALEGLIRRSPGQYYWGYNRYKVPAGVDGSSVGENADRGGKDAG
ncbi:MAG: lysophospholipid acyltransferase family protein [Betaproteobacteria bacterium]|nr:lysophospholipid acyltransferase family protein [Betaproteobacteria bacterium]